MVSEFIDQYRYTKVYSILLFYKEHVGTNFDFPFLMKREWPKIASFAPNKMNINIFLVFNNLNEYIQFRENL
jgi:hypothetical protein